MIKKINPNGAFVMLGKPYNLFDCDSMSDAKQALQEANVFNRMRGRKEIAAAKEILAKATKAESAAKPRPVAVSKITAKMLKEEANVRTLSATGVHFTITTEQEHTRWSRYACINLEQGTTYPCESLDEIRQWMSLN